MITPVTALAATVSGLARNTLRLLVPHAAGEVAVGGADAAESAWLSRPKVSLRAAQAGRTRRLADLRPGGEEDLFQRLAVRASPSSGRAAISLVAGTTKVSILTVLPLRMPAAARKSVILPPVQEPM